MLKLKKTHYCLCHIPCVFWQHLIKKWKHVDWYSMTPKRGWLPFLITTLTTNVKRRGQHSNMTQTPFFVTMMQQTTWTPLFVMIQCQWKVSHAKTPGGMQNHYNEDELYNEEVFNVVKLGIKLSNNDEASPLWIFLALLCICVWNIFDYFTLTKWSLITFCSSM